MLILERHSGEAIHINDDIKLTIYYNKGSQIKLGIEAPRDVPIMREELLDINKRQHIEKQAQELVNKQPSEQIKKQPPTSKQKSKQDILGRQISSLMPIAPLQSLKSEYQANISTLLINKTESPPVLIKTKRKRHIVMPH